MVHLIAGLIAMATAVYLAVVLRLPLVVTGAIAAVGLAVFESLYEFLKKR